ncbi:MAG: DUF126 domain-containing protein [Desulfurococcales archaeon]|nr:DUF126 domain-containing protein [Desulfurococcales archaeon]
MIKLRISPVVKGSDCCAEVLLSEKPISFLGDVDVTNGMIKGTGHISGRILLIPASVGSTVGSYILYALSRSGKAPLAIVASNVDPILITGAVIGNIPLYKLLDSWDNVVNMLKRDTNKNREGCIIKGEYLVIK